MDRLHLMQVFTRIVESGSFSAVAKEMNMLQPTVSKHMNALENILGVRLLIGPPENYRLLILEKDLIKEPKEFLMKFKKWMLKLPICKTVLLEL